MTSLFSVGFCFGGALSLPPGGERPRLRRRHRLLRLAARAQARGPTVPKPIDAVDRVRAARCCRSSAAPTRASRQADVEQFDAALRPRGRDARDQGVPGRPAQLLRPEVRRVRGRLRRRLEADARLRRRQHEEVGISRQKARRPAARRQPGGAVTPAGRGARRSLLGEPDRVELVVEVVARRDRPAPHLGAVRDDAVPLERLDVVHLLVEQALLELRARASCAPRGRSRAPACS